LHTSQKLLDRTRINPDTRVRDLSDEEVGRLRDVIDKEMRVEGDLRREVSLNIKRLMDIGSYAASATDGGCRSGASGRAPTPAPGVARGGPVVAARRSSGRRAPRSRAVRSKQHRSGRGR
jgi:hypothetical protein